MPRRHASGITASLVLYALALAALEVRQAEPIVTAPATEAVFEVTYWDRRGRGGGDRTFVCWSGR